MLKAAYWIVNYEPKWEAASKEVRLLSRRAGPHFTTQVYSLNTRQKKPRVRGGVQAWPMPFGILLIPFIRKIAAKYHVNHLFASAGEPVLTQKLAGRKALLTVAKGARSLLKVEKNLPHLKKFRFVVVESERDRQILEQGGLDRDAIKLIYPGFEIAPYRPARGPFRMLFASSPFSKYEMLGRGLFLILQAAERLRDVQFLILWRERFADPLLSLIAERKLSNVEVRNTYVPDMSEIYDTVHGVLVPALDHDSLKPCPHSALESLAHGKPIVTSSTTSLAGLVRRAECGVCCEPDTDDLVAAIGRLRAGYDGFQARCHPVVRETFSPSVFESKYMALYHRMTQ